MFRGHDREWIVAVPEQPVLPGADFGPVGLLRDEAGNHGPIARLEAVREPALMHALGCADCASSLPWMVDRVSCRAGSPSG